MVSRLKHVVLPAPFGPINAWMLPRRTRRSTSRTAEKPANSLLNPRVSRMYSSANHISPTIAARIRAWPICSRQAFPRPSWKSCSNRRLRARICRQRPALRKPETPTRGRADGGRFDVSPIAWRRGLTSCRTFSLLAGAEPRQALVNGVSMPSCSFIEYLGLRAIMMKNFQNGSKLWNSRAPTHRSSDRSSSGTC